MNDNFRTRRTASALTAAVASLVMATGTVLPASTAHAAGSSALDADIEGHITISIDKDQQISSTTVMGMNVAAMAMAEGVPEAELRADECLGSEDIGDLTAPGDSVPGTQVQPIEGEHCGATIETPPTPISEFTEGDLHLSDLDPLGLASVEDVTFINDSTVYLDLYNPSAGGDEYIPAGTTAEATLTVRFPGKVESAPGAEVNGNTATWELFSADSEPTATGSLKGFPWWVLLLVGGIVIVLAAGGVVALLLVNRRKRAQAGGPPFGAPGTPYAHRPYSATDPQQPFQAPPPPGQQGQGAPGSRQGHPQSPHPHQSPQPPHPQPQPPYPQQGPVNGEQQGPPPPAGNPSQLPSGHQQLGRSVPPPPPPAPGF